MANSTSKFPSYRVTERNSISVAKREGVKKRKGKGVGVKREGGKEWELEGTNLQLCKGL